jgi:hypothetical protein
MMYGAGYEVPDTMFCTACCCCGFPLRCLLNQDLKHKSKKHVLVEILKGNGSLNCIIINL